MIRVIEFAVVVALSAFGVGMMRYLAHRHSILDIPNERSSHTGSVARGGGVPIVLLVLIGLWLTVIFNPGFSYSSLAAYTTGAILVAGISWLDDLHSQSYKIRFSVHSMAAILAMFGLGYLPLKNIMPGNSWLTVALSCTLTFLWIVGLTNAYNFMDGIDGLAGAQAVVAGLAWLVIGSVTGQVTVMWLGLLISATTLGFLLHNWSPARIFMGDVGSAFLGYTLAVLPLIFNVNASPSNRGLRIPFAGLVLVWPFVFDSMLTFFRRLFRGERVFTAHRSHLYQRMVIVGRTHHFVSLLYAALAAAGAALAVGWVVGFTSLSLALAIALPVLCASLWLFVNLLEYANQSRFRISFSETPMWKTFLTRRIQFALDLLVLIGAFILAYLLRFEFDIPPQWKHAMWVQLAGVVLLQFVALNLCGVHSFVWRYVGINEVRSFVMAAASVFLALIMVRFGLPHGTLVTWRVPLSICVMDTVLAFGGVLGLRVLRRSSYELFEKRKSERASPEQLKQRVLLIGAGRAGVLASREILNRRDINLNVIGFVDDDSAKQGSVINRIRVLGTTNQLPKLTRQLEIDHVIITMAQASRYDIQRITKICEEIPIKVRIIPGLYEILDGRVEISRIRDVQIEDLLGRQPVELDIESISRELTRKIVMVTGAGGSIGSELARQVAHFAPARLILIERAEFALFNIDRALRDSESRDSIVPLVADIGDQQRMRAIFETHRPHVVIHAAAHKHVPLMESNSCEAIKNNVLNTRLLSELAAEFGVEAFVLISTDKAVRPTSIMGASKRLAELVVQDAGSRSRTRFVAVRFGNVIGSNGSAIPIFKEQIRKGGPVTITDRRMRRYFMTIPEAAQLVLQASTIGKGGEVFILHMGEPVSILELAEALISLSGMKPHQDIKIVETGIRPGEKLNEELTFDTETTLPTSHAKIAISKLVPVESHTLEFAIKRLNELIEERNDDELRTFLNEFIPEAQLEDVLTDDHLEKRSVLAAGSGA